MRERVRPGEDAVRAGAVHDPHHRRVGHHEVLSGERQTPWVVQAGGEHRRGTGVRIEQVDLAVGVARGALDRHVEPAVPGAGDAFRPGTDGHTHRVGTGDGGDCRAARRCVHGEPGAGHAECGRAGGQEKSSVHDGRLPWDRRRAAGVLFRIVQAPSGGNHRRSGHPW